MATEVSKLTNIMKAHIAKLEAKMAKEGPIEHPRWESKSRLSYWFPLIEDVGLPVPKTTIIRLTQEQEREMGRLGDGKPPSFWDKLVSDIALAAVPFGLPFFLRTDFTSAKHYWNRTCCVQDPSKISDHVYQIWEFSELADFFGLPTDVWVVREMLKTVPKFHAFVGKMPITREFRFFILDGEITHIQPYWPKDAIQDHGLPEGWESLLEEMSVIRKDELHHLAEMTRRASQAVPGYWSVDWLETADRGWVLTDMALGEDSYAWSPNISLMVGKS